MKIWVLVCKSQPRSGNIVLYEFSAGDILWLNTSEDWGPSRPRLCGGRKSIQSAYWFDSKADAEKQLQGEMHCNFWKFFEVKCFEVREIT